MFSRVNAPIKVAKFQSQEEASLKFTQTVGNSRCPWSRNMLDCEERIFNMLCLPSHLSSIIPYPGRLCGRKVSFNIFCLIVNCCFKTNKRTFSIQKIPCILISRLFVPLKKLENLASLSTCICTLILYNLKENHKLSDKSQEAPVSNSLLLLFLSLILSAMWCNCWMLISC